MEKECRICKVTFPATKEYFYAQKHGKYGLRKICKQCKKKEDRSPNPKRSKEILNSNNKLYYKLNTSKIKQQRKVVRDSLPSEKKKEISTKLKSYYKAHSERLKKQSRDYKKTTKGQEIEAKKRYRMRSLLNDIEISFSMEQWKTCKTHFDNRCAYCGHKKHLEKEHFIPLSRGGEYTVNNIVPACRQCNGAKYNKLFFDWYSDYEKYSKSREMKILDYLGYNNNQTQQLSIL